MPNILSQSSNTKLFYFDNIFVRMNALGKLKCLVMFQYSICDMHFCILKSEVILGISVRILVSNKLFFLNSARRQILLFVNKKKNLVGIQLTFLQEVSIIVRVNMKVSKDAKIRNRYNQVPCLTQDTKGKVTNSQ